MSNQEMILAFDHFSKAIKMIVKEAVIEAMTEVELTRTNEIRSPATRQQAAAHLSISLPTLDSLIRTGQIKTFNVGGRSIRLHWDEIDRYVNENGRTE